MTGQDSALLRTEDLTRKFEGLVAVDRVTFGVRQGTIKSVVGPNGAGKTTLFNLITGLDRPTAGRVICQGRDISGWPPHQVARATRMARTFQTVRLFGHLTVLENVMIGRHLRSRAGVLSSLLKLPWVLREEREVRERALEVLEFVGLAHRRDFLAHNLPYGEQRRLELARALASEPRILLLDEPAAGLNEAEANELAHLIGQLRDAGMTVLLIEHQMRLVMDISEEVLVLHFGRVLAEGTPSEVQKDARVIEAYLGTGV